MKKGGHLEALVEQELNDAGAAIRKADPPFRILRNLGGGRFEGHYQRSGVLDFVGTIAGLHVEFDAKDVKGQRFDLKNIRPDQWTWARTLFAEGATVAWLVRFRGERAQDDELWLMSHGLLLSVSAEGKKSITTKRLSDCRESEAAKLPLRGFGKILLVRLKDFS